MTVNEKQVKNWLQDEGLFFQQQSQEGDKVHYAIKVPLDIQQSINMGVYIPKDKEDQLGFRMNAVPGKLIQDVFATLEDKTRVDALRRVVEEVMRGTGLIIQFGNSTDGRLGVVFEAYIYSDAPLTKHLMMSRITELRNAFLFYDMVSGRIFKEYGNQQDPLVAP